MIKKMISAAALIAAGTALASADTSGWTELQLTQTEIQNGRKTLSELGLTQDYNYVEYSWCVSFTLDISKSSTNGGVLTFTTSTYNGAAGVGILTNTTNGAINIATLGGVHLGTPNSTGGTFTTGESGGSLDITINWDAVNSVMTLSVYQDGMDDTYVTTWVPADTEEDHPNLEQYASLTTTGSLLTHSGDDESYTTPISNIAIYVRSESNVPEPSMFGVLAGLGALGLVATRRRRNRKA